MQYGNSTMDDEIGSYTSKQRPISMINDAASPISAIGGSSNDSE